MRSAALAITVAATLMFAGAAVAQSTGSTGGNQAAATPTPNQPSGSSSATGTHGPVTINQLKQELQQAGFSDVKVLEDAFVVEAKTKDGHPIVLTIGPNGFSAVESLAVPGSSQQRSNQTGKGSAAQSPSSGQPAMK